MNKPSTYEWQGVKYIVWHGDPFDRGSADSYYGRPVYPHRGGVGGDSGPRQDQLNENERAEYLAGYAWNEANGDKKSWD
jgi:hypothetical protein